MKFNNDLSSFHHWEFQQEIVNAIFIEKKVKTKKMSMDIFNPVIAKRHFYCFVIEIRTTTTNVYDGKQTFM